MACVTGCEDSVTSLRQEADRVTDMLCTVLDTLETAEEPVRIDDLPRAIQDWWEEHKQADIARQQEKQRWQQERREAEEARERALAKLTPEERRALGLD